jgi:hypothetical protein
MSIRSWLNKERRANVMVAAREGAKRFNRVASHIEKRSGALDDYFGLPRKKRK